MTNDHRAASNPAEGLNKQTRSEENGSRSAKPRRFGLQISLATFLLLIALSAVSLVWWQTGQSIERLEHQLVGLRAAARELKVDDPAQFAVVKKIRQWHGQDVCEIYVPAGRPYQLCMNLDAIDKDNFPDPQRAVSLPSGVHRIEIARETNDDGSNIKILVDDKPVIEESRPNGWDSRVGRRGGISFTHSTQYPADQPLELFRQRFMNSTGAPGSRKSSVPTSPSAGILVWVESEKTE